MALIDHQFVTGSALPALPECLFQYLVGSNGVFCRAARPEMTAIVPISSALDNLRGLVPVQPGLHLNIPRVPSDLVIKMVGKARSVGSKEILFYLLPPAADHNWQLATPAQHIGYGSVYPLDPFSPWGTKALIEVHSHHGMSAFFSKTDDRDEASGFRLYGVLGEIYSRPVLRLRVGIYGHFWTIPASLAFEMPYGLRDGFTGFQLEPIETEEEEYGYIDYTDAVAI